MGLALSILVFSIGVLEALSCLEHVRYSYLPLDLGRKRRRLVLDVGSGTIRHRETRRSSEFQRDQNFLLRRLSKQLQQAEDDVCEELSAIWDRVESGRVHSTEVRVGGEGSEAGSRSSTPDTVVHVPEDDTTDETDIPLEDGFCPKCVDENFDLLASALHKEGDVKLGVEGACYLHDNINDSSFTPINKENDRFNGQNGSEKGDLDLKEDETHWKTRPLSTKSGEVELISSEQAESPDLAPHQPCPAIIDVSGGEETTGSGTLITSDLEDSLLTQAPTPSLELPATETISRLSGVLSAQAPGDKENLPHESMMFGVENSENRLGQIEARDACTPEHPITTPKTLIQEVTEIVSEWLGLSKDKFDQPKISQDELNKQHVPERARNVNEMEGHVNPLFICFQEEQPHAQMALLKSKEEPEMTCEASDDTDRDTAILGETATESEELDTNISENKEVTLTKQETAKGKLQKQNNIDIGRINKHKEMLRTGTYVETDLNVLNYLEEQKELENSKKTSQEFISSNIDGTSVKSKLPDSSEKGYSHTIIESSQIAEQVSSSKKNEGETIFQPLVEENNSELQKVVTQNILNTDECSTLREKELGIGESTGDENYAIDKKTLTESESPEPTTKDPQEKTNFQGIKDNIVGVASEKIGPQDKINVHSTARECWVQSQVVDDQDDTGQKIFKSIVKENRSSKEVKTQFHDVSSKEANMQLGDTFAQNQFIEQQDSIDNKVITEEVLLQEGKDNKVQSIAVNNKSDRQEVGGQTVENGEIKHKDKQNIFSTEAISIELKVKDKNESLCKGNEEAQAAEKLIEKKKTQQLKEINEGEQTADSRLNIVDYILVDDGEKKSTDNKINEMANKSPQSRENSIDKPDRLPATPIIPDDMKAKQVDKEPNKENILSTPISNQKIDKINLELEEELKSTSKGYSAEIPLDEAKNTQLIDSKIAAGRTASESSVVKQVENKIWKGKEKGGKEEGEEDVLERRVEVEELGDEVTRVEGLEPPAPVPLEDITSPDKAFWLIFSGEYTKAMSKDWHSGHFCCWQCDESLTGQRYVLRDDHPYCIKCYEQVFANTCDECSKVIGIDSKDLSYKDKHWHEACFLCSKCRVSLVDKQFGSKADKIYCGNCYDAQFASRCDGCGQIFRAVLSSKLQSGLYISGDERTRRARETGEDVAILSTFLPPALSRQHRDYGAQAGFVCALGKGCRLGDSTLAKPGTKKMEYKTRQWHEQCFCCCVCKTPIGTKSFIPREQEIYCAGCYEEKFATRCVKCNKIITSGGVTYKNEPWHRECFTCTNCSTSLAGQRFTSRDEKPYCADCFGELFAKRCTSCCKPITGIGGTRFISFEDRHWHNDCFICASCKSSLVGRGFITDAEDILCTECAKQKLM